MGGRLSEVREHAVTTVATTPGAGQQARRASRRLRQLITTLAVASVDAVLILVAFAVAYWLRYMVDWPPPFDAVLREVLVQNQVAFVQFLPVALPLTALLLLLFQMRGLYRLRRGSGFLDYAGIIVNSTITAIAVVIVVVFLLRPFYYSRLIFALALVTIVVALCTWRSVWLIWSRWRWASGVGLERVLVVGGTGLGREVMNGILAQPHLGLRLVGYLGDPADIPVRPDPRTPHLGDLKDLERVVLEHEIVQVIIALPFWEHNLLPRVVQTCRALGVEHRVAPDLYELSFDRVDVRELSGVPLIDLKELSLQGWNLYLKRAMDLAIVIAGAPFLLLLGLLIATAIRLDSRGPVLFKQQRIGRGGKPFMVYKFRTMVRDAELRKVALQALNEADGPIFKIRRDPRITRVGRWLRRSSLDELPQLWNVLRGEMSVVGPRPYVPDEVERFEPWHRRCLEVAPGMTGLWQVLGRSDTSFDERVRLDIYYAENWTPGMDVRILLLTLPAVLSGKGAY